MLDTSKIGTQFDPFVVDVEAGRLRFFAQTVGENNPIYSDKSAAIAAGYRDIPAPPTFTMVLDTGGSSLMELFSLLELDISRILHGSQSFEYFETIYSGDRITVNSRISDIYDKKQGALEFIILESSYLNSEGSLVARSENTLVYR
ncbi:MAG: MaoC family dehydratase N-terminal domain-containing protein [Halioglobus sp.]